MSEMFRTPNTPEQPDAEADRSIPRTPEELRKEVVRLEELRSQARAELMDGGHNPDADPDLSFMEGRLHALREQLTAHSADTGIEEIETFLDTQG